jgi:26S proteasome regulatory subunit N3
MTCVGHIAEVRDQCRLIERAVLTKESRFAARVLRSLFALRKRLNSDNLAKIIQGFYTHSAKEKEAMLAFLPPSVSLE